MVDGTLVVREARSVKSLAESPASGLPRVSLISVWKRRGQLFGQA